MKRSTAGSIAVLFCLIEGLFAATVCPLGQVWAPLQYACIPEYSSAPQSPKPKPQSRQRSRQDNCPPGRVWVELSQMCVSFEIGLQTSQAPQQKVAYSILPNAFDSNGFPRDQNYSPLTVKDLFKPPAANILAPQNQPFDTPDSVQSTPSSPTFNQPNPNIQLSPVQNVNWVTPFQTPVNQPVNSVQSTPAPPPNIIIIYNSSGIAISQGLGSAVALSNSSNAGVGVGGAALSVVGNGTSPVVPTNSNTPTIIYVINSSAVNQSSGGGTAVGTISSQSSGVGVGGSATSIIDSLPSILSSAISANSSKPS